MRQLSVPLSAVVSPSLYPERRDSVRVANAVLLARRGGCPVGVRIGTWNLENLFRPGQDGGPSSQATYDAKLSALAATIADAAPDVLAVQEVGDPAALADLAGRLDGRWHRAVAEPDRRGIRVGYLS